VNLILPCLRGGSLEIYPCYTIMLGQHLFKIILGTQGSVSTFYLHAYLRRVACPFSFNFCLIIKDVDFAKTRVSWNSNITDGKLCQGVSEGTIFLTRNE